VPCCATSDTSAEEITKIKSGQAAWAVDQQPYLQRYETVDSLWLWLTNGAPLVAARAC
jgi:simple sugar transport system substrate-binding protein